MLLAGIAILVVSGWVGDAAVDPADEGRLVAVGSALLGLVGAVAVLVGLRSGSRGGPLALERPEIHHVLLAPIDRRVSLRRPAVRQVRFLGFAAAAVGVVVGQLAARRLPGNSLGWVVAVTAWAVLVVVLALAAAWVAGGIPLPSTVATSIGLVLAAWSAANVGEIGPPSPTTLLGGVALWPLRFHVASLIGVLLVAAVVVLGFARFGTVSVERLSRRSRLVGQLRFAATMRDVRTVMLLRRQLTQELTRQRPWLRTRRRGGHTIVVRRGWRSLVRTPAVRWVRMAALGGVCVAAAMGAWAGTTPLLVVAGIAAYLVGLEALEPMAQEVDHPTMLQLLPVPTGSLLARHLIVPAATMVVLGVVGAAAVALATRNPDAAAIAALTVVPAALAGTVGAAISIVKGVPDGPESSYEGLAPPELTGMRLVYQTAIPPAVATAGFLPVVSARAAASQGLDPVGAAASTVVPVLLLVAVVVGWVRYREDVKAWIHSATEGQGAGSGW